MRVLALHEKHDTRLIRFGDTPRENERAAAGVVQDRILDGYWYTEPGEQDEALDAIRAGKALGFLRSRSKYEYEGISIEEVEDPHEVELHSY